MHALSSSFNTVYSTPKLKHAIGKFESDASTNHFSAFLYSLNLK